MNRRTFFIYPILFAFISCSGNHLHDGKYEATVMNPNNWYDFYTDVLTITGNQILDEKYDQTGDPEEKIKVPCTQYPDRIEFEGSNGVTRILTVQNDGSLMLSADVVYSKLKDGDSGVPKKIKTKALIKIEGDTIKLLK